MEQWRRHRFNFLGATDLHYPVQKVRLNSKSHAQSVVAWLRLFLCMWFLDDRWYNTHITPHSICPICFMCLSKSEDTMLGLGWHCIWGRNTSIIRMLMLAKHKEGAKIKLDRGRLLYPYPKMVCVSYMLLQLKWTESSSSVSLCFCCLSYSQSRTLIWCLQAFG